MNQALHEYIAEKVMIDLREARDLNIHLLIELNKYPQIDYLRKQVQLSDVNLLLSFADYSEPACALVLSMCNNVSKDARIRSFLLTKWSDSTVYFIKSRAMWRLLDYPDLANEMHMEMYEFVKNNWDHFISDTLEWFGHPDKVLPGIKLRFLDQSVPISKYWIYLCQCLASPDKIEVRSLIDQYKNQHFIITNIVNDFQSKL